MNSALCLSIRSQKVCIAPLLAVFLPPIPAVPLVYHAAPWHLSEMEERILAIETRIDPLGPQSAPKPADSWQKKKNKKRNPQLFSFFLLPSASPANPTQSQPSTLQVIAPALWCLFLPYDHTSHFPFHLSLLTTSPPSTPSTPQPLISDVTLPCVRPPVQHFFFHSRIQFSDSPLIFPPPAHLSSALSSLHLLPSLSAHLLHCVHKRSNTHTHTHTHPFRPAFYHLPPAVCSPYWRLSRKGLATDLIRVSVVAKVESVALRFTAGT